MVSTLKRQTGVIARVVDDNLNSWEDWAGQDINVPVAYQYVVGDGPDEWEQGHWSYRGQAAMCLRTTDGAIVRVRIGDGTSSDRKVYRQIVTDPTDESQWTTWTQLYTGDHYAVAIEADAAAGAGYRVFHAKSDGLYVDNTLKITKSNIIKIKPATGATGVLYFQTVAQDVDGERALLWWFTPDVNAGTPTTYEDCASYRWYRHDLCALTLDTIRWFRYRAMAHQGAARNKTASTILTVDYAGSATVDNGGFNTWNNVRFLKGPSGQAGYKTISDLYITSLTDTQYGSAYYLFYTERHRDSSGNVLSNLKNPLFWSRSASIAMSTGLVLPYYLSAPVPTGYSIWGFAGAVPFGSYLYVAGNGRVIRRPLESTEIDISNYVLGGDYEVPRDNGKAEGTLVCANPANVLGAQMGLTDASATGVTERRIEFGIGLKRPSETFYTWKRDAAWWISALRKIKEEGRERLQIEIADFWHKMANPFRDTYQMPGRLAWTDWQPDARNQLYNYSVNGAPEATRYSPAGADEETVPRLRAVYDGSADYNTVVALFAGWRGENALIKARLWTWGGLVFRYVDADNYYYVQLEPTGIYLRRRSGDPGTATATLLASVSWAYNEPAGEWMEVQFRWGRIQAWWNGQLLIDHTLTNPEMYTGMAGAMASVPTSPEPRVEISNLTISEWHQSMTMRELVRILLAYADEHNVELEIDEETASIEQVDLHWGPQSDLDTPEKALRQLLDSSRLNVVWLED